MFVKSKTRRADETGPLHLIEAGKTEALCGEPNQRKATRAEREAYLAPHCFTCAEDARLDAEDR